MQFSRPSIKWFSSSWPEPTCLPTRAPVFSAIWRRSSSPLCLHHSPSGPRLFFLFFVFFPKERQSAGGEECQYKHRSSGFLQARRAAELISRYWFLTAAHLLLCPPARRRACAPPLYRPPARHSDNLTLVSLTASALLLSRLVQQLIRHPHHHPFFSPPLLPIRPSPADSLHSFVCRQKAETLPQKFNNNDRSAVLPTCRVAIRPSVPDFY